MNFKSPKLLFVLLLVIVVSFAGCSNKLLSQFAGKNIGVYVFYDALATKPFEYQNSPIPASEITLQLVKYFQVFQKKITAVAITPEIMSDNNILAETYQKQLFSDLSLDNLLLIKITGHNEYLKSLGVDSKGYYDYIFKCNVNIHYQLLGKDESTLLFTGTGQAQGILTNYHSSNSEWFIQYKEKLSVISDTIIMILKKANL